MPSSSRSPALTNVPDDLARAKNALDMLDEAMDQTYDSGSLPAHNSLPQSTEPDPSAATNRLESWTRLPDETNRSWEVFSYYRDLGPGRSYTAVVEHFGITRMSLQKWIKKFDWAVRVREFDQHEDRVYQIERERAIRDMAKRHGKTISETLEMLTVPIQALSKRIEDDPDFITDLSQADIKTLFRVVNQSARTMPPLMTSERAALGMPTSTVEVTGEVTVTHEYSRDQIAEVLGSLQEAGAFTPAALGQGDAGGDGEIVDGEIVEGEFDEGFDPDNYEDN